MTQTGKFIRVLPGCALFLLCAGVFGCAPRGSMVLRENLNPMHSHNDVIRGTSGRETDPGRDYSRLLPFLFHAQIAGRAFIPSGTVSPLITVSYNPSYSDEGPVSDYDDDDGNGGSGRDIISDGRKSPKESKATNDAGVRKRQRAGKISYRVKKGDTLYRISRKFNAPLDAICRLNGISENGLQGGMILKIPGQGKGKVRNAKERDQADDGREKKPRFTWPIKNVLAIRRDSADGVKGIGLIITGSPGSRIVSSAPGTVRKIGSMRGYGRYVVVEHEERYITVYANLSEVSVAEGEGIASGKVIGRISLAENRLHFQINHAGKPRDPLSYLPGKYRVAE